MPMVDDWDPEGNSSVVEDPEEPVEEQDPAEDSEPERLYAGKYKNAEELEKGYIEAQSMLGRLGNRVGELEKKAEEAEAEPEEDPFAEEFWNVLPQDEFVELLAKNPAGVIGEMARRISEHQVTSQMAEINDRLEDQGQSLETQQLTGMVADWMGGQPDLDSDDRASMQRTFNEHQEWFYDDLASGDRTRVHTAMSAIATLAGVGRTDNGSAAGATRVPRTAPSTRRPATGGNRGKSVGDQILDAMSAHAGSNHLGIFGSSE